MSWEHFVKTDCFFFYIVTIQLYNQLDLILITTQLRMRNTAIQDTEEI